MGTKLEVLTRYRTSRELTREALGKELGVSGVTIGRWESGERLIGAKSLPVVSSVTGIPARELRPDLMIMLEAAE